MNKKYDILHKFISDRMRVYLFQHLSNSLYPIGAMHRVPNTGDIEFAAFFISMYLLNTLGVELDSDMADINEVSSELNSIFAGIEDVKQKMFSHIKNKRDEEISMSYFDMNNTFEA